MNTKTRKVGFKTIFDLIKQKPVNLMFGLVFTLLPIQIGGTIFFIFNSSETNLPKVDIELITNNGALTQAIINNIEIQSNISINDEHPRVISYSYNNGNLLINDKFRTLDSIKTSQFEIGDTIQIKYYNGQSIIDNVNPMAFPMELISSLFVAFFIIGLIIFGILYLRIKGQIDLIKNGIIMNAEIISMTTKSGFPFSIFGKRVTVHYKYQSLKGEFILGESISSDFAILNSMKQGDIIKIFVSPENEKKSYLVSRLDEIRNKWEIS